MWEEYNPNPTGRNVGDCAIRAVAKALDVDWEKAYAMVAAAGFHMGDMPSSDSVWGAVLRKNGFYRKAIPDHCPDCYSAEQFAREHPEGTFVVGFGGHVACIRDGILFDSWNSLREIPIYYWYKKEGEE